VGALVCLVGGAVAAHGLTASRITSTEAGAYNLARSASEVTVRTVRPTRADRLVTGPQSPDLAMVGPRSRSNGLLAVFLPGTGDAPDCCKLFLRQAVSLGYLAIGLTYNNQTAVATRCLNDLACFGSLRRNVFDGADASAYSNVSRRDGVEHRLAALLSYLASHHPREGWGRFVRAGQPIWTSIVMSGHSQGGGEAAFIATIRRVRGVVTLSSPLDTNLSYRAATWVTTLHRGRTSIRRMVGFVHSEDPFYPRIIADWTAMGLKQLGAMTSVDTKPPPYRHTHELLSSAALPSVPLAAHDSTAVDSATPKCRNGSPEYAGVWDYMLELAGGLPISHAKAAC
jgi:hypothetical protein